MDQPYFVTGLWSTVGAWLESPSAAAAAAQSLGPNRTWVPSEAFSSLRGWIQGQLDIFKPSGGGDWSDVRYCFATNFFVVDLSWWRSPLYRDFFRALDDAGGFYR